MYPMREPLFNSEKRKNIYKLESVYLLLNFERNISEVKTFSAYLTNNVNNISCSSSIMYTGKWCSTYQIF